jgi:hypothetical protein
MDKKQREANAIKFATKNKERKHHFQPGNKEHQRARTLRRQHNGAFGRRNARAFNDMVLGTGGSTRDERNERDELESQLLELANAQEADQSRPKTVKGKGHKDRAKNKPLPSKVRFDK